MFITQISNIIDDLLTNQDFYQSNLYKKINNLLYVPISKIGEPYTWMFLPCVHVNLNNPKFYNLKLQLEKDYYSICNQLNKHIRTSNDGFIHTSNGQYIQIRSKYSKRANGQYNPIHSNEYNKYVSNKNHAFYFKKDFMKYITNIK